jgi:probable HAF family extracellular repeat protein
MQCPCLLLLLISAFLFGGFPAAYAASYTFTSIGVPGALGTFAFELNNDGQLVGLYVDSNPHQGNHGFLYDGGEFFTLDVPFRKTLHTQAFGINNRSQIVGGYFDSGGVSHGFLYDAGSFTTIDVPSPGAFNTFILGINDKGQIVGQYQNS